MEDFTEVIEQGDVYDEDTELEIIKLGLREITSEFEDILENRLMDISEKLLELKKEFQGKIKYDSKKDNMIDELHKELRGYRDNLMVNSIKPLILDLISVKESYEKVIENLRVKEITQLDGIKVLKAFESVPTEIEDALYRQGIDSYSSEGEVFDGKKHKILKIVETVNKEADRRISKSIRNGYIYGDKIIKKEFVYVYIYKELDIDAFDYCI